MSRTRRNYEHWVDWLNNFDLKLARGHASVPIRRVRHDGSFDFDEAWGIKGKRFAKQLRARRLRRRRAQECHQMRSDTE